MSEKSRLVALILCWWFGWAGGHRFYVGKTGTAILYLFTLGLFGIGIVVDLIMIILGKFFDKFNKPVLAWMRRVDADGKVLDYLV